MIYDVTRLPRPARIRADVCVVGTGPGGGMAASAAAQAGLNVVMLEAGGFIPPGEMNQREEDMLPALLWHAGARTTTNRAVHIHQGRGVGGSSLHNTNLCKRIPAGLRARWAEDRGLKHLPPETWDRLYDEVEARLHVSAIDEKEWSRHNRILQAGCDALGWRGSGLRHNRSGCNGSGYCELGCIYDAKNTVLRRLVPDLIQRHRAQILTHCQAVRVRLSGGEVTGVDAVAVHPHTGEPIGEVFVDAPRVCLSASATGTAALLLRSDVPDPGGETGRGLRIHPAVVVAGEFAEPVAAWRGIPQAYECTEWLDLDRHDGPRTWIVPAFGHPMGVATMLPGHGEVHRDLLKRYAHLGVLTAMLHDHTAGSVEPKGDLDVSIDYWPDAEDRAELSRGLERCARLLLAAGARKVHVPTDPPTTLGPRDDPAALARLEITPDVMDLTAVHPMASVPMGDDPAVAAVDSRGRHHHVSGLWIADGSLFPTSIGVPPQISIYALGLHVGRNMAAS